MTEKKFKKTAWIETKSSMTISMLYSIIGILERGNFQYVFINEATAIEGFADSSAFLSDIYASSGMKIVLSGTDSLIFKLATSDQLYNRAWILHTTFIPYREMNKVLGIQGIDEYIQHIGPVDARDAEQYVDRAVVKNISHSLGYRDQDEFSLTIHKYLKDMTIEYLKDVIAESNAEAFKNIHETLNTKDSEQYTGNIITRYLHQLDILFDINCITLPSRARYSCSILNPIGLRYAETAEFMKTKKLKNEIIDNLLHDTVLLETKLALPEKHVFTIRFSEGGFDMLIFDSKTLSSEIYMITGSTERDDKQYLNLIDDEKCRLTEHSFGTITGRHVIYRGPSMKWNDIDYINIEEYLNRLPSNIQIS